MTNKFDNKIIIVGLPGAGKSTIGKKLAKILNVNFFDIDKIIENQSKKTINEIFSEEGESFFRKIEEETIKNILENEKGVISLGAGAIKSKKTLTLLTNFPVVYLEITLKEGIKRTSFSDKRPLLANNHKENYEKIFNERNPIYRKVAKVQIQTRNRPAKQIIEQIIRSLGLNNGI